MSPGQRTDKLLRAKHKALFLSSFCLMKNYTYTLIRLLIFWMVYFQLLRLVFVGFYAKSIRAGEIETGELLQVFIQSLKLDFSTASYIGLISMLLYFVSIIVQRQLLFKLVQFFNTSIIIIYALTVSAEIGLYAEWKTKLSAKALSYLRQPGEVFQTAGVSQFMLLTALWLLLTLSGVWLYRKYFRPEANAFGKSKRDALAVIWLIPVLFFGVRGGFSAIPVSVSSAYFSRHAILNAAAVNPLYNIAFSMLNAGKLEKENVFKTMPEEQARKIVSELHQIQKDTTVRIFEIDKPNIVVLLLESWSADLIESLGGEPGITPNFHLLEKEGLLFTRFYANANRSQQAMGSLFGGIPGIPFTTITDHPDKYAALPSLSKILKKYNYQSAFYFGGQLNYGNILSYLISNDLDVIEEGKDLPQSFERGRLGVHDGDFLPYVATRLKLLQEPFFATAFTLSSHAPYDFPMEHVIDWPLMEKPFVNGAHYTDRALALFFELARKQEWYQRTIFLIMADHSKNSYRNHPLESFEYHHIPLLIYGEPLKQEWKGKTYARIAGNTDVPATLLHQLGIDAADFFWSKNLLNPYYKPFAYFELNEGLGWKRDEGYFVWDKFSNRFYQEQLPEADAERFLLEGQAYLQVLYDDFLAY